MSEQIKDGGSAFPVAFQDVHSGEWMAIAGMTLHDYFAAKAMQAAIAAAAGWGPLEFDKDIDADAVASFARKQADAMLAASEAK